MRRMARRIGLLCLVLAVLVLQVAAQTAIVSIGTVKVAPNSSVTLPLIISRVMNLGSGTIDVSYDPAVVHVTGVTDGTGDALKVQAWNVDNATGIVQIVALDAATPHSGTVIFANVTFSAVGEATQESPLNITVRDLGDYFNYTENPRSVTVTNGTVTISQSEEPTPKPTSGGGGRSGGGDGLFWFTSPSPTSTETPLEETVTSTPGEPPSPTGTPPVTSLAPTSIASPAPLAEITEIPRLLILIAIAISVTLVVLGYFMKKRKDRRNV
ncbi:MAG: hypothetical protein JW878_02775 [Methanomicrobia archaeon]|nr:hypothetical protein [Methanomicrobia archaeon]